jgi:ABC-type oligopeptide transport system substrate-binding subunit
MDGLFDINDQMKTVPILAKSWKVSPDGRTYEFKIREDIKWTDGKPLTADDFVFSWQRLLTPETAAPAVPEFDLVEGAKDFLGGKLKDFSKVGIKAIDTYTLQVRLKKRLSGWQNVLVAFPTFPMRRDIIEKFGNEWTKPGNIQTLGAYVLSKVETQQRIVLKANPNYFGKKPQIIESEAYISESGQTAISLFKSKKLDVVSNLSYLDAESLKNPAALKFHPTLTIQYLGFVLNKYPMTNQNFRRAISLAIDKSGLEKIMGKHSKRAERFVPTFVSGLNEIKPIFSVEKAKAEFKKSGVDPKTKIKVMAGTGSTGTGHPMAEYIQQQLKSNLGLDVEIDLMGLQPARESRVKHTSQLFIGGFFPDYADPYSYFAFFHSDGFTLWQSDRFKKTIELAENSVDPIRRKRLLVEAEDIILDEAPVVPLIEPLGIVLVAEDVEATFSPVGYLILKDTRFKK